jgi:DNA-binding CsgD family transcriptional regulator
MAESEPGTQTPRSAAGGTSWLPPLHLGAVPPPSLTPRQLQVLRLLAAGCSDDQIGLTLGISGRTARAHCDALRMKLGVQHRRQLPFAYRKLTGADPLAPLDDDG